MSSANTTECGSNPAKSQDPAETTNSQTNECETSRLVDVDDSVDQNDVSDQPIESSIVQTNTTSASPPATILSGPIRVPGTYPPEWLPDQDSSSCMACENLFTIIKRRHHCRACGKIFCSECCRQKAKLLYLDNKEARVCDNCFRLVELTLIGPDRLSHEHPNTQQDNSCDSVPSTSATVGDPENINRSTTQKVLQGVLKTGSQGLRRSLSHSGARDNQCNASSSSSSEQHSSNKQVIFADGIRPGTDLSEPFPHSSGPSTSSNQAPSSILSRQNLDTTDDRLRSVTSIDNCSQETKSKRHTGRRSHRNITVCDELGYLPPIVIYKDNPIAVCASESDRANFSNPIANLIYNQLKSSFGKRGSQAPPESQICPYNGIIKFEELCGSVGVDKVVTFLLLRDYYLRVKLVDKSCCHRDVSNQTQCTSAHDDSNKTFDQAQIDCTDFNNQLFWCFVSDGLDRFGQPEVMLVIDKSKDEPCIPRDIFKIYLTLHELVIRRQSLENLGNLLFQDGLFGNKDTAGLLFVRPLDSHCKKNLITTEKAYLVAIILQRWEVPWSKVFPMRLLIRLGYKYKSYPYPIISFKTREPVYYEIGHTIISILGDFRNFRYSLTHVDGLKVSLNKTTRTVLVELNQVNYNQFNKVLDSSSHEHVLAWSSDPFSDADGHLVSVQGDDGQYETVEFLKRSQNRDISFEDLERGVVLGASFIVFSGALKINQTGQPAKISLVEDGLLVQIQSGTMSALKNAIQFMHHFDIDCESSQDSFNRVEIHWKE